MKVYVITKAKPFHEEIFVDVATSRKQAEKILREKYPYMKPDGNNSFSSQTKEGIMLL